MRKRRSKTWILLGYLLLLWNVGPSAHHAEFLGFHPVGHCGSSSCSINHAVPDGGFAGLDIAGHCDCGNHSDVETTSPDQDGSNDSTFVKVDSTCHDCLLCQFFDQFNAMPSAIQIDSHEAPFHFLVIAVESVSSARSIKCTARGPPAVS